jgi:hypothetical protein
MFHYMIVILHALGLNIHNMVTCVYNFVQFLPVPIDTAVYSRFLICFLLLWSSIIALLTSYLIV